MFIYMSWSGHKHFYALNAKECLFFMRWMHNNVYFYMRWLE